jgi:hypothetical protein
VLAISIKKCRRGFGHENGQLDLLEFVCTGMVRRVRLPSVQPSSSLTIVAGVSYWNTARKSARRLIGKGRSRPAAICASSRFCRETSSRLGRICNKGFNIRGSRDYIQ